MIPAAWLAGAVIGAGLMAGIWYHGASYGAGRAVIACREAQDRAEREHRSEVARIADAASVAAADALQARQTVRRLEHAARINPPVQCDAGDAGVDRLRDIINPAGDPAAGSPAR